MYRLWMLLILIVAAGEAREAEAQAVFGVEWRARADTALAFADFEQMVKLGLTAVRTGAVADTLVWQRADSLGLTLFQEVNIDRLSAAQLLDTLGHAREAVLRMAFAASASPSVVPYIGLARNSETTDPAACAYYEALTETVRQWTSGRGRTYYLTGFIDDDVCHQAVDFVLVDALNDPDPAARRDRWQRLHPETPVGLGRMNWRVESGATPDGWKVPHTEAWQAHRMRAAIDTLATEAADPYFFLYRWRDVNPPAIAGQRGTHAYGLYDGADIPRRAADVVERLLTNQQRVFLYPEGEVPPEDSPWSVLAGWMVVLAVGIGYGRSAMLQQNVQRYFSAHSFYQEAVVRSRDLSTPLIVFFAAIAAVVNGLIVHAILSEVEGGMHLWMAIEQLPAALSNVVTFALTSAAGRVLVCVAFTLGSLVVWGGVLSALAGPTRSLPVPSAYYLILWPRWLPTAVGILAAMLIASGGIPATPRVLGVMAVLWILSSGYAFARTLADYTAVVRPSVARFVLVIITYPPFVALAAIALGILLSPQREWIWHLITRS